MFLRCGWIEILIIGCGIAINSLYFYYFLITSCWKVSKQWKWQHTESQIKSPFLRWNWGLLSFHLLPFRFWLMFMDINESVGTQIAKIMGPRHCRSDSGEGGMSFIINFLLQQSNALNKIKEHRACVVIYFLDLQPTVKIISKKTISPLLSLSEFKWQNFWARLSGTRHRGKRMQWQPNPSPIGAPPGEWLANTLHLKIEFYHLTIFCNASAFGLGSLFLTAHVKIPAGGGGRSWEIWEQMENQGEPVVPCDEQQRCSWVLPLVPPDLTGCFPGHSAGRPRSIDHP